LQEAGKEYLTAITARLLEKGIHATYKVTIGSPANIIVSYADEKIVSLITMSTHGRSGIARWVFGSVTEKVLHGSTLPMLLVRSPGMQAAIQDD
jgi:nucleotide-binding universal stress UspA family protein